MWGIFFEDINRSGDGGLYAELVKNSSFDFPESFMGWSTLPSRRAYDRSEVFHVLNRIDQKANPKFLRVTKNRNETVALTNESFGGLYLSQKQSLVLSISCQQVQPGLQMEALLLNGAGKEIGKALLTPSTKNYWQEITARITTTDSAKNGRIQIKFTGNGILDLDRVSLFPSQTWKGRKNGLRMDMAEKLAALKPGFFRFPGGCIVEGDKLTNRYDWKTTIGPLDQRKLIENIWQNRMEGRELPDYFQSFGLGFYEYFQLCEDIGASPMPIINCGMSCQFNAGELVPLTQLQPFIQDALDLIEFANGETSTKWGKIRADLGHPAPFAMKYLGVGNENWGPQYLERLKLFTTAIKSKYPEIQLVNSTGYAPDPQFPYMDSALRQQKVDIIDEHYYQTIPWMLSNATKYDRYDRKGPKIFIGEYACMSEKVGSQLNKNTLLTALAEACFMTGLERNADIVTMAAYAPLFAHVKDWQWTPNMIWFDNASSYATPNYYVQQLFSLNKGTHVVNITEQDKSLTGQDSIWASAVVDENRKELVIKIINPSAQTKRRMIQLKDLSEKPGMATLLQLGGQPANTVNNFNKEIIKPVEKQLIVSDKEIELNIPAFSMQIIRLSIR
jgi:alpha-N-arabinofuranosidase